MTELLLGLVKVTAVLAAGWALYALLRGRAHRVRHAILAVTLVLVPLVVLVGPAAPKWDVPVPSSTANVPSPETVAVAADTASQVGPIQVVLLAWAAGAALLLLRFGLGVALTLRLRQMSAPRPLQVEAAAAVLDLDVRQRVTVSVADVACPLTYGLFRHRILLPDGFGDWPEDRRRAVLLHEAAHVKRFDCAWTAFSSLLAAVLWCHPLVWLLARALRNEAELAADERVVASGVPATDYAGHLVAIARLLKQPRGLVHSHGVTIMSNNNLENRVKRILGQRRKGVTTLGALGLAFGLGLATVVVAGATPQSQETPAPPASPGVATAVVQDAPKAPRAAATEQVKAARAERALRQLKRAQKRYEEAKARLQEAEEAAAAVAGEAQVTRARAAVAEARRVARATGQLTPTPGEPVTIAAPRAGEAVDTVPARPGVAVGGRVRNLAAPERPGVAVVGRASSLGVPAQPGIAIAGRVRNSAAPSAPTGAVRVGGQLAAPTGIASRGARTRVATGQLPGETVVISELGGAQRTVRVSGQVDLPGRATTVLTPGVPVDTTRRARTIVPVEGQATLPGQAVTVTRPGGLGGTVRLAPVDQPRMTGQPGGTTRIRLARTPRATTVTLRPSRGRASTKQRKDTPDSNVPQALSPMTKP